METGQPVVTMTTLAYRLFWLGMAACVLVALYFVVRAAVRDGLKDAGKSLTEVKQTTTMTRSFPCDS